MILAKLAAAFDLRLPRFLKKSYRDGYLGTHVRGGIALQIRALREKAGLSQDGFAQLTGKKQSTISRLEDTEYGRVNVQTLLDIATATNVALLVRFVDYPQFLRVASDMSPKALAPNDIFESNALAKADERNAFISRLLMADRKAPEQVSPQGKVGTFVDYFEREAVRNRTKQAPPTWDAGNVYQSAVQRAH